MFEKEAEEWVKKEFPLLDVKHTNLEESITEYRAYKNGAEFGYNKGYHDAEEHYLNVIDSQHKLVDESRKKDFKKCMKCTDGTYQYGFKDGYNKANEWHKDLPTEDIRLAIIEVEDCGYLLCNYRNGFWYEDNSGAICAEWITNNIVRWKEIVLPKED